MPENIGLESDPVASEAVKVLVELARPTRVWLFGSRARGEHNGRSDYDFALENSQLPMQDGWKISEALESLPTLRRFDVVWLEFASDLLREEVVREGICVYER